MFYFMFEATPRQDSPVGDEVGGAYINCWVDRPTIEAAERLAIQPPAEGRSVWNGL